MENYFRTLKINQPNWFIEKNIIHLIYFNFMVMKFFKKKTKKTAHSSNVRNLSPTVPVSSTQDIITWTTRDKHFKNKYQHINI